MVEDIDLFLSCHKAHFYFAQRSFSQQADFCMYTHFYYRRAKSQSSVMAPRKASKASAEISGKAQIMFLILHHEVLILSEPGHTSPRFCSPNW
jgi:hypothetical protein